MLNTHVKRRYGFILKRIRNGKHSVFIFKTIYLFIYTLKIYIVYSKQYNSLANISTRYSYFTLTSSYCRVVLGLEQVRLFWIEVVREINKYPLNRFYGFRTVACVVIVVERVRS
jgi:hypothetical protein